MDPNTKKGCEAKMEDLRERCIGEEPWICVGIVDRVREIRIQLNGTFRICGTETVQAGDYQIAVEGNSLMMKGIERISLFQEMLFIPEVDSTFTVGSVKIGINFHWERQEKQTFRGELLLSNRRDGTFAVINRVRLEDYLLSVTSSEMSPEAPCEFLKAQAITSRSWLGAMLERRRTKKEEHNDFQISSDREILRWYDREEHDIYDVCADDHCQRYQGIEKTGTAAARAVQDTNGVFLVHQGEVCDARFSKSCGGLTEDFSTAWEDRKIPYLTEVPDATHPLHPIQSEREAAKWINSRPDVFCNLSDGLALWNILPSIDRETDFFRWRVTYSRLELEDIIREKSGVDFGCLKELIPIARGRSGRISKLKVVGSSKSLIVGKELEIRRWLSRTHLLSSAITIRGEAAKDAFPKCFVIDGAGWGHGVGMCQIGASGMALRGFNAGEILRHYFRGAELKKLY
jgi:SpoIID/LytB domain protein